MRMQSKNTSLLILAITALVSSRTLFAFINDPEGPNLLVVVGLAILIYIPSLLVFPRLTSVTSLRRVVSVLLFQVFLTIVLYLFLR